MTTGLLSATFSWIGRIIHIFVHGVQIIDHIQNAYNCWTKNNLVGFGLHIGYLSKIIFFDSAAMYEAGLISEDEYTSLKEAFGEENLSNAEFDITPKQGLLWRDFT